MVGVGRLTGVFGIKGGLKCKTTADGADAFAAGRSFAYRNSAASGTLKCAASGTLKCAASGTLQCTGARRHHERLLLRFAGIDDPESASAYVGAELFAERDEVALGPDEFLDADLVGLRLIDETGRDLARVIAVEHYPAQDCLVVTPGNALVPLVKAFVRRIDLGAGTILTTLPEGLLE